MSLEAVHLRVLPNRCRVQIGVGDCRTELTLDDVTALIRMLHEAGGAITYDLHELTADGQDDRRLACSDLSARRAEMRVLQALEIAAAAGLRCPSNDQLATRLGIGRADTVVGLIKRLEARGAIRVHRQGNQRQVTIVATNAATQAVVMAANSGRGMAASPARAMVAPDARLPMPKTAARQRAG